MASASLSAVLVSASGATLPPVSAALRYSLVTWARSTVGHNQGSH